MPFPQFPRYMHHKLDGRRAVPCKSIAEWSAWFAVADRRVAETWIDDVRISTVFLGLDHNHGLRRQTRSHERLLEPVQSLPEGVRSSGSEKELSVDAQSVKNGHGGLEGL